MSKPNIVGKLGKGNPHKIWEIVIKGYSNNQITSTYTQGIRPTAYVQALLQQAQMIMKKIEQAQIEEDKRKILLAPGENADKLRNPDQKN